VVYRDGQALTLTPNQPGYDAIFQAGTTILSNVATVEGRVPLPAGVTQAQPANSVQFVYLVPGTVPSVTFHTAFGALTLDRAFLLLDPLRDGGTAIWASSADGGWITLTSRQAGAALRAAVTTAVAGRADWDAPPTPLGQGPAPSSTAPAILPVPPVATAGKLPPPPPPTQTVVPLPAPIATSTPAAAQTPAPLPPTETFPTPPPLPMPPAESTPGGADAWRKVAGAVIYPLYVPAPDAGLIATHGPYQGDFPLEAGGPGTYPGVAAGYRVAATGALVTVVELRGWPGDKAGFGPLQRENGILGFYYEDATQRRLIVQPAKPYGETDVVLRAGRGVSRAALFALAAGLQPLPYAPATPTPPDPASAQTMILDLSFADATHGWLLWSSCLSNGACTTTIRATTDGGRTWPVTHPAPPARAGGMRFVTAHDGWVYGDGGLAVTHDAGATWTNDPQLGAVVLVEPVGNAVWAVTRSMGGGNEVAALRLLVSTDLGRTWTPAASQPAMWGGAELAHSGSADAWLLSVWDSVGQQRGILSATHDGGKSWQERVVPCHEADFNRLAAGPGELWLACAGQSGAGQSIQGKQLYRSTDDGRHWEQRAVYHFGDRETSADPPSGTLPAPTLWGLVVPAPGQGWMIFATGWLARSLDAGTTWQHVTLPYDKITPNGFGLGPIRFVDPQHGWVAGRSGLFRTTDGGTHWETILLR